MTVPLTGTDLVKYNNVPTTPLDNKLGDIINELFALIGGGGLTPASHRQLDQLVHLVADTTYFEVVRTGGRVSDVIYWTDNTKTTKVRETNVTRTSGQVSQVVMTQYDAAGLAVETLTGTVNRTGGLIDDIDWVLT